MFKDKKPTAKKPFTVKLEDMPMPTVTMVSGSQVRMRLTAKLKKVAVEMSKIRPQQYSATFTARKPATTEWKKDDLHFVGADKMIKIAKGTKKEAPLVDVPATEERKIFETDEAIVSNITLGRDMDGAKVGMAVMVPIEFFDAAGKIKKGEVLSMELRTAQLSLC
jgi:hypothetical protein